MSQNDQNELLHDVNGVNESSDIVKLNLVPTENGQSQNISNQLKQSSDFLHDTLKRKQGESEHLQNTLKQEKENLLPKNNLKNDIINAIAAQSSATIAFKGIALSDEKIDEVGVALITNYCSINATARQFGMSEAHLRHLITIDERLAVYHEIAHDGVKALTDEHLIKGLRDGDPDIIRLVATRMYAGRNKGGYNISEIGTINYKDKLSKQLAEETASDRAGKTNVKVTFNFVRKDITKHSNITRVNDAYDESVDAEFEDVEDDSKQ
jgi:AraC-like DNA-binding protein